MALQPSALANTTVEIRPYLELMRLHQPTGIWLLLWPAMLGLWIAHQEFYLRPPGAWLCALVIVGAVVARSLGCVINDILDRNLDRHVARTKTRPLATGTLSVKQALVLVAALAAVALSLLIPTNGLTVGIAAIAGALIVLYPLAKRFIPAPQLVLAVTFSMGIPMAYGIALNWIDSSMWWLFAANASWIMAYDTIYAMLDSTDDFKQGMHSTALLFGDFTYNAVACFQAATVLLLVFYGIDNLLNIPYYLTLMALYFSFCWQQHLIRKPVPEYMRAFRNNIWGGAGLFAGGVLNYLWFV